MNKYFLGLILAFCAIPGALLAGPDLPANDDVFRAMRDEMARSMDKLRMDALDKPYFLDYEVIEGRSLGITASFGAIESEYASPYRRLKADLRVGSPVFDNSNYAPNVWEGYREETDWSLGWVVIVSGRLAVTVRVAEVLVTVSPKASET